MATRVEHQSVVGAPPALTDLAALEDGVPDPVGRELARDRQAGRFGTDDDEMEVRR